MIGGGGYQPTSTTTQRSSLTILTMALGSPFNATETSSPHQEQQAKPRGYVRIEEWDAQRKTSLEWEEKVKFDGHASGNRWQQHEILRQHLFR